MEAQAVEQRKKKFLMMVPVIAIPFFAFIFYMMGGGRERPQKTAQNAGLNPSIPSPIESGKPMDKLSLYQQAEKDSLNRERDFDPFLSGGAAQDTAGMPQALPYGAVESPFSNPQNKTTGIQPLAPPAATSPEARVESKLRELERMLKDAPQTPPLSQQLEQQGRKPADDMQQLEGLMQELRDDGRGTGHEQVDPELAQMNGMLEKILDIQHPERMRERTREKSVSEAEKVFPVSGTGPDNITDLLTADGTVSSDTGRKAKARQLLHQIKSRGDGFFELGQDNGEAQPGALSAVIHQNQTLSSGGTVKLRLLQDAYVQGRLVPKGNFVHGTCSITGERLEVSIPSIRVGSALYPVSLAVYDLDGLAGIRIPGSMNRDAAKEGTDQALQAITMGTLDPSIGAQAASAGIEAAKSLLKRKAKAVRVHVKADYPVLLADSRL